MASGNIKSKKFKRLAHFYEFEKMKQFCPRGSTPADVDGYYYFNSHPHYSGMTYHAYLHMQFRCKGKKVHPAQESSLDGHLERAPERDAVIFCEHPDLEDVKVPQDVLRFKIRMLNRATGKIQMTDWIEGDEKYSTEQKLTKWIQHWFWHVEDSNPNKFVSAFRKKVQSDSKDRS